MGRRYYDENARGSDVSLGEGTVFAASVLDGLDKKSKPPICVGR